MTLRDRIPVEPLSDDRMTNIERRVVIAATDATQIAPRRVRWLGVAAAMAVVVVGIASWKLGASSVTRPAQTVAIVEPIRIDTMTGTQLDIGDARITSDPLTKFVVTRPDGGVLVEMARGKVELEVGKRGDRAPLVVRAGDTDVVVVGTRFSVDYGDGTGDVKVIVTEGVVKVVTRSQPEVRVAIGQAWTTTRGQIAIADLPSAEVAATGSVDVAPIDLVDRHAIEIAPETATQVGSAGSTRPPGKKVVVKEDARKALLTAGIQPAYDIGIADPKAAIQKHLEVVANTRNEEASRAQYSIAVLQKLALKDNAAALKTLDRYFDRFAHKNKSEHGDALWLRVRILCEKTFDDDCRRAARMYAAEAPSTFKSGIAEKILDGL